MTTADDPLFSTRVVDHIRSCIPGDLRDQVRDADAFIQHLRGSDTLVSDPTWREAVRTLWRAALSRARPGIDPQILAAAIQDYGGLPSLMTEFLLDRRIISDELMLAVDAMSDGVWVPVCLVTAIPAAWWPHLGLRLGCRWRITGDFPVPVCQVFIRFQPGRAPDFGSRVLMDPRTPIAADNLAALIERLRGLVVGLGIQSPAHALEMAHVDPLVTAGYLVGWQERPSDGYGFFVRQVMPEEQPDQPGYAARLAYRLASHRTAISPLGSALLSQPFEVGGWDLRSVSVPAFDRTMTFSPELPVGSR